MDLNIADSWKKILQIESHKPYFKNLITFVKQEYAYNKCYPKETEIFAAFNFCALEDLKVVLIGQDPYHGEHQANGLCFSVQEGISHPPSLQNIFKELANDLHQNIPQSGNLESWAKQGVLLLNATLTVRAKEAESHQKQGWETFTDAVIKHISATKENVVFLLWGGFAKKKANLIDIEKHFILQSGHPSPLSANRGYWFGNKHFSTTNQILNKVGKEPIKW